MIRLHGVLDLRRAYPEIEKVFERKNLYRPSRCHRAWQLTSHDCGVLGRTGPDALKGSQAATMLEWLTSPFLLSTLCSRVAMNDYELNYTVPSPGNSIAFMEFSPNGRFLAVGDQGRCSLYILDRLAGFHPTISAATPAKPAALVWETTTAFYVGLGDGRFIHYQIGLGENKLVKGTVNNFFYGVFPVTAIAIDVESKTLVLSVGPDVFAFRRIRETGEFCLLTNQGSKLMWFEMNSASLQMFQVVSTLKGILETHPHSQDPFVLPLTTHSSSRFAGGT